jgi:hypothetical protein
LRKEKPTRSGERDFKHLPDGHPALKLAIRDIHLGHQALEVHGTIAASHIAHKCRYGLAALDRIDAQALVGQQFFNVLDDLLFAVTVDGWVRTDLHARFSRLR